MSIRIYFHKFLREIAISISNPEIPGNPYTNIVVFIFKQDNGDSRREIQGLSNILVVCFDWLFFLGISPFRFVCVNQNIFKIYKNDLQMAVSSALSTLSILCSLSGIRMGFCSVQFDDLTNPRNFSFSDLYFSISVSLMVHSSALVSSKKKLKYRKYYAKGPLFTIKQGISFEKQVCRTFFESPSPCFRFIRSHFEFTSYVNFAFAR